MELAECTGCRREKKSQHKCTRCRGNGNEPKTVVANLIVCPNCESYFGASSAGDLSTKINYQANTRVAKSTRDRCPYCGETRLPCQAIVLVPVGGLTDD